MTKAQTTISYADMAMQVAIHVLAHDSAKAKSAAELESANVLVMKMSKDKVKVGANGKCAIAMAFHSTLMSGGKAKGTANNYLSTFRKAVESGKPITEWNPAQSKAKAGKGGKGKGKSAFSDLLLKAFNHDEGKTFVALCAKIEKAYNDAKIKEGKGTMYDGFVDFMQAEGFEIKA
jgi:hypothetical protein